MLQVYKVNTKENCVGKSISSTKNQAAVDEMKYPRDNNLPVLDALSANCIQQSLPETLFVSATCYREV